jgi:uncharacterized protein
MTRKKGERVLRDIIRGYDSLLVSYSGGVDSTLLAAVAESVLGSDTRAVFLDSPLVPRAAVNDAKKTAADCGIMLDIIKAPVLAQPEFIANRTDRCYTCKKILAAVLLDHASAHGLARVADGANSSDLEEHRPGLRASTEAGIVHPFIEAGISKKDIRKIAQDLDLPVWQKPSAACLASRIPYGDAITREKLRMIEEAEGFLAALGFGQLRVRLHGTTARIEVHKEDWGKILEQHEQIAKKFRSLGFTYITLDLEGYRSGSMDEVL